MASTPAVTAMARAAQRASAPSRRRATVAAKPRTAAPRNSASAKDRVEALPGRIEALEPAQADFTNGSPHRPSTRPAATAQPPRRARGVSASSGTPTRWQELEEVASDALVSCLWRSAHAAGKTRVGGSTHAPGRSRSREFHDIAARRMRPSSISRVRSLPSSPSSRSTVPHGWSSERPEFLPAQRGR